MSLDITKFNKVNQQAIKDDEEIKEIEHSSVVQAILEKRKNSTGPTLADLQLASVIYSNNQKAKETK